MDCGKFLAGGLSGRRGSHFGSPAYFRSAQFGISRAIRCIGLRAIMISAVNSRILCFGDSVAIRISSPISE